MADSKRETVLHALHAKMQAINWMWSPTPVVERNAPEAAETPLGGRVNLRDGDMGEPIDVVMGSPAVIYTYDHQADIVVLVQHADGAVRDAHLDRLCMDIGAALLADDTLGGAVDYLTVGAMEIDDDAQEGAEAIKGARIPVSMMYDTNSLLV